MIPKQGTCIRELSRVFREPAIVIVESQLPSPRPSETCTLSVSTESEASISDTLRPGNELYSEFQLQAKLPTPKYFLPANEPPAPANYKLQSLLRHFKTDSKKALKCKGS